MKKTLIVLLALVMVFAAFVPAFAEEGVTAIEQEAYDLFAAGRVINGVLVTPPAKYLNEAMRVLLEKDFNEEDVALIKDCVVRCYDILEAEGITSMYEMENSPRLQEVVDNVDALCRHLGFQLDFNFDNGDAHVIMQTGHTVLVTVIIASVLVAAAVVCVVIINRRKLLKAA